MRIDSLHSHAMFRLQATRVVSGVVLAFIAGLASGADLVVTHIGPYSGPAAATGKEYGAGAQLYFTHVNAGGGVCGSKIVLVARDDAGNPELTRRHAVASVHDNPVAFIGAVGASSINSLAPTLKTLQAPLLGPLVDSTEVSATDNPYVFHIRAAVPQELEALAVELRGLGIRKIALCHESDTIGVNDVANMQLHLSQKNVGLLVTARCDGEATDIAAAANAIAAVEPQAVIFAGHTQRAAAFIKVLRAKGSFALVASSSSVDPKLLVSLLPPDAAIWLAVAQSVPNPRAAPGWRAEAIVDEFLAIRSDSAPQTPLSRASLTGFITAKIAVAALRRAGRNPTSADVLHALAMLGTYDVGGMTVSLFRDGRGRAQYTRLGILSTAGVVLN